MFVVVHCLSRLQGAHERQAVAVFPFMLMLCGTDLCWRQCVKGICTCTSSGPLFFCPAFGGLLCFLGKGHTCCTSRWYLHVFRSASDGFLRYCVFVVPSFDKFSRCIHTVEEMPTLASGDYPFVVVQDVTDFRVYHGRDTHAQAVISSLSFSVQRLAIFTVL